MGDSFKSAGKRYWKGNGGSGVGTRNGMDRGY